MMSTLSSRVPPKQARLVMTELRTRMRPSINGYLCVSYEEEDTCVSPFEEEDTCVSPACALASTVIYVYITN